jgi:hypothetical protein
VFSGDAVNNGTVAEAIFLGNSQNGGTVTLSATFAENAGNLDTGLIQGDAVFADNTVNAGTVQGNAEIAATANGEQGDVYGSITTYTQPDGAFAFGYYSGGVKAAAPSYATVVYQAGIFWYKYDASGNATLANGTYSDGTSGFVFVNGVKGAAAAAPVAKNGAYSDGYYLNDNIDFNYANAVPQQAQDNGLYYTYSQTIAAGYADPPANGAYSTYYFNAGAIDFSYSSAEAHIIINNFNHVYYSYNSGGAYLTNGFQTGVNINGAYYYINGARAIELDQNGSNTFDQSSGVYSTYNSLYYENGVPYSGTKFYSDDGYGSYLNKIEFVSGVVTYNGTV